MLLEPAIPEAYVQLDYSVMGASLSWVSVLISKRVLIPITYHSTSHQGGVGNYLFTQFISKSCWICLQNIS